MKVSPCRRQLWVTVKKKNPERDCFYRQRLLCGFHETDSCVSTKEPWGRSVDRNTEREVGCFLFVLHFTLTDFFFGEIHTRSDLNLRDTR